MRLTELLDLTGAAPTSRKETKVRVLFELIREAERCRAKIERLEAQLMRHNGRSGQAAPRQENRLH